MESKQSDYLRASAAAIEHWRELRLGMFIHWGPVSLRGTEIGWSRGATVPVADYDRLGEEFNPVLFNADEWATIARAAGMRYLVLTTKHHDGFCLWPTQQTDHHIGHTPFRRDIVGELAAACRRQGLAFGAYYSICDWRHPDYPFGSPAGKSAKPAPNMDRYDDYLRAQLTELQRDYGPLLCFWFDGEWESAWTTARGAALNNWLHQLQPGLLVNNRVGKGRGADGRSDPGAHPGDFWTPEQVVGAFAREFPWETCMTIGQQWAWKPNDEIKFCRECLDILVNAIAGDGNLLFNVGPMPDGRIEARQVRRLREFGTFVQQHAAAIYGTRGGPFKPGAWGGATCRDRHVYLFLRPRPATEKLVLPALGAARVQRAATMAGAALAVDQTRDALIVTRPAAADGEYVVVQLELDRSAVDLPAVAVTERPPGSVRGEPAPAKRLIKSFCADFNWDLLGRPASPGLHAQAAPAEHVRWYKTCGVNTIQTFCVSYNGYAWYQSAVAPVTPGMKGDFLREMVELGHAAGMQVTGYFCLGSNPHWELSHRERGLVSLEPGYGPRLPLTIEYLDYFCRSVEDVLRKIPIDGFMIDWFNECRPTWVDGEKLMYGELMGNPFPGAANVDEAAILEFRRRAIDRAWGRVRTAAKSIRPEAALWVNVPFEKADDPLWTGSRLLREADWLLNEGPNFQLTDWLRREAGPQARVIQNLCGWATHEAGGWEKLVAQGVDLYGFAAADPATTLPREDDNSANARNLAVIRQAYASL